MTALLLIAAGVGLSVVALGQLPEPFIWIFFFWICLLAAAGVLAKTPGWRAFWFNLSVASATLFGAETYFWATSNDPPPERYAGDYTTDYFVHDEIVGYKPASDRQITATKYVGVKKIYDVVYTINRQGLRVSPPIGGHPLVGSLLFFGGSVTFGEGVADAQAMPYLVGLSTANQYRVYNFAFHGYGPHQMLASLEGGFVERVVQWRPAMVVYQAIPAHVARSAGRASWDSHGPRYERDGNSNVQLVGHFNDFESATARAIKERLENSRIYRRTLGHQRAPSGSEIDLFVNIVRAARDYTSARFPGCEFHVLFWGNEAGETPRKILEGLQVAGIRIHLISDILPEYKNDPSRYELNTFDKHPNPLAHRLIARYVANQIVDDLSAPGDGSDSMGRGASLPRNPRPACRRWDPSASGINELVNATLCR
jgi:hypothetical protein